MSKIILPLILLIAFSLPSMAQTKYEFSIISIGTYSRDLQISFSNGNYEEKKLKKTEIKGFGDASPALKEVERMIDNKWELFDTNIITGSSSNDRVYVYYLRREKQ